MTAISYAILAHSNPKQLGRLITKLNIDKVRFFVHIDAKVDIVPFLEQTAVYPNVQFVANRIDVRWGAYSVLEAYLECLKQIRQVAPDSFVVQLSGQDYPIKSNQYIAQYISEHSQNVFIAHFKLPYAGWSGNGGLDRVHACQYVIEGKRGILIAPRSFRASNLKNIAKLLLLKPTLFPLCMARFFKKRNYPLAYTSHWGGEFWSSMPMCVANQILELLDSNKEIEQYYRLAGHPDEIMLHTLLLNNKELYCSVVNNCLQYIDWPEKQEAYSPITFTIDKKEQIHQAITHMQDKLFARKFGNDTRILDYIDHLTESN